MVSAATKEYLVADLFCGAGGTSTGCRKAIEARGAKMLLVAVNHWPRAIETHSRNHPEARHYIDDVTTADPYLLVPEGYLDLLMASPECRHFSRARGGKPVNDQGRMPPWAVHRWATALDVRCILVENVPEFTDWGPLLPNGQPDPKGKGLYFQAWIEALWKVGYKTEWKLLNAANFGDATTRVRFFLQARKDGRPICWPEPSHAPATAGRMFGAVKPWRAAREIIDWTAPGRSLLDDPKYKKKPLSIKTRRRIARGLEKFGGVMAPLYIQLLGLNGDGVSGEGVGQAFVMGKQSSPSYREVGQPLMTVTTESAPGLVEPEAQPFTCANRNNNAPKSTDEPLAGITTAHGGGLLVIEPLVVPYGPRAEARPTDEPLHTVMTKGRLGLARPEAQPFTLGQQSGGAPRDTEEPLSTVTADGAIALVRPFLAQYNGTSNAVDVEKPLPSQTTKQRFALAEPTTFVLSRHGDNGGCRAHDVGNPLPTVDCRGGGYLIESFVVPQFGERDGQSPRVHDTREPLPAVTSHGAGALVTPQAMLVQIDHGGPEAHESGRVHPDDEPVTALTTKQNVALARPVLIETDQWGSNGSCTRPVDAPLFTIVTKANQGVAEPVLVATNHTGDKTDDRVRSVEKPLSAITTKRGWALIQPVIDAIREGKLDPRRVVFINGVPHLLDIRFRMLFNSELARAMGFSDAETQYEFCGTATEITKQIGNAVPVHLAAALVGAVFEGE